MKLERESSDATTSTARSGKSRLLSKDLSSSAIYPIAIGAILGMSFWNRSDDGSIAHTIAITIFIATAIYSSILGGKYAFNLARRILPVVPTHVAISAATHQSIRGVTSFVLSLVVVVGLTTTAVTGSTGTASLVSGTIAYDNVIIMMGWIAIGLYGVSIVGFFLGVMGLSQSKKKRSLAWAGTIANAAILVGGIVLTMRQM